MTSIYVPEPGSSASYLWALWSTSDPHPFLQAALNLGVWLRFLALPPLALMLIFYEKYHQWGSSDRWQQGGLLDVSRAKHLGRRPTLVSIRTSWWHLADWLFIPISGILFLTAPQLHAHILQLWTDKLDYKVASKPMLDLRPVSQIELLPLTAITTENMSDNEDGSSRNNRFFLDDANSSVSHGDSGFFEFEPDGTINNNSPGKKRRHLSETLKTINQLILSKIEPHGQFQYKNPVISNKD